MSRPSFTAIALLAISLNASECLFAQRSVIRREVKKQVEKDMEEKYADPHREKGREEIKKVTYENDPRYKDPTNKVQATMAMQSKTFDKKGEVKTTSVTKMVFGKTGECMVMNEGQKEESRFLFDYAKKANYMVQVKQKTAMKMPLINMQKMATRMAANEDVKNTGKWKATNETQTINGYKCRKYIYTQTDKPEYAHFWVSKEVNIDLSGNYLLGDRIKNYVFEGQKTDPELPAGFMVRSTWFDKNDQKTMEMELLEFSKTYDEKYFDLTGFKVNDVLGLL